MALSIRSTIESEIAYVAQAQRRTLAPLTDELALANTGLDSLDLAILVARLDAALGFDPFTDDGDSSIPITFGDFVRLYERAAP
jgi:hypothetical protein